MEMTISTLKAYLQTLENEGRGNYLVMCCNDFGNPTTVLLENQGIDDENECLFIQGEDE